MFVSGPVTGTSFPIIGTTSQVVGTTSLPVEQTSTIFGMNEHMESILRDNLC